MGLEQQILAFLSARVFDPVLDSPNAPEALKSGVRFSIMCLSQLPAPSMVRYFRDAVAGTGRSLAFSQQMRDAGFDSFEDVQDDFETEFGHLDSPQR